MPRKILTIALITLMLTSHLDTVLTLRVYAAEETDALTALRLIEEELERGKIPSSSITETCFIVPEGFPVELAQRLWFFTAQLISMGCSEEEIRRTIKEANNTLKLPARIDYELKDYVIILEYEKIHVHRNNDGSVSVEIPYRVVDNSGNEKSVSSIEYESNGTNVFHVLYRYPKKRTYLVRRINPDSYAFTFVDLETGKVFNKTAKMDIGLFSNVSQGYPLGSFLIAVPGHLEEIHEVMESQVSEFRVLLPAYDPVTVDTSISSTKVGIGDTITITAQIRNPQEIRGSYRILLGARLSDNDAFEAWAPPPGPAPLVPLYLKAKKPGVYTITIYFAVVEPSNLDVVFWNGEKTVTYTIEVLPEPPKLEIKLSSQAISKFANLTITLMNKGGQKARNVKLLVTGDVDGKELEIGTIVGLWSKCVVTKLLSPITKVNVTVVYFDEDGKRYTSTALTTISTTNFVASEEWRSYVIEVEGYNETRRVFTPRYQGATHIKLYLMATDGRYPQDLGGVRLIPISPDGFTLTVENASNIAKATETLNVKYVLIDVRPGFFYERILREDEVKKLFGVCEDERLEPNKIPPNYELKLLREVVLNQSEVVTVSDEFYEWLKYNDWEDYDYKYEDIGETKWDLDKAAVRISREKEMELIYHPLAYGGGDLIQGILVRNYAACDVSYNLEIINGPVVEILPEEHTISIQAFGSIPLQLIRLEDMDHLVFLSLKCGDRIVARLQTSLGRSKPSEFWRGFWDGFASKGWGIIVTCGIMIIVGFVLPPKWAVSASIGALATGIAMNLVDVWTDVHNALAAMDLLNGLADACECRVKEYVEANMLQHADELLELAQIFRLEAKDINDNLLGNVLSDLALGISWDEIRIAFRLKEPSSSQGGIKDYGIGYATGRVAGAIASCAAYVTTFYMVVNRIRAERIGGKPLSVKEILGIVGRGIYNWITPAIWDVLMLKLKGSFHKVVDLLLGNKYSWRFGEAVGNLIERADDSLKVLETASGFSKYIAENIPSKESSGKILDILSMIIERCPEELEEKGGAVVRSIVSIWIKDKDAAIDSLNNWLGINAENPDKMEALVEILVALKGDAAKGVGLKMGAIVDSYFDIKGRFGEGVAGAFLSGVLENPAVLNDLVTKINSVKHYEIEGLHQVKLEEETRSRFRIGGGDEVKPGTYMVKVYWEYGEEGVKRSGVIEFPVVKGEPEVINIPKSQVNRVLKEIESKEASVTITKVEFLDYRLFFPTRFSVGTGEVELNLFINKMRIGGKYYQFNPSTDVYGEKVYVDAEFEGRNIFGKNLVLSFYQSGEIKIRYGTIPDRVEWIMVDPMLDLMTIHYYDSSHGVSRNTEYSFNLKPLSEQLGKHPCEILVRGQKYAALNEELFRLLGYKALDELKSRIGSDISESNKVVLFLYFDNGRVVYCGAKNPEVYVIQGASKITCVEIVPLEGLTEVERYVVKVFENPQNTHWKGKLGETIAKELYIGDFLDEISKESGIPKEKLGVEWWGENKPAKHEPDFKIKVTEDIIINGKTINKDACIAVVEAKYLSNPNDPEDFKSAISEAKVQVEGYMGQYNANHGIIIVMAWDPNKILEQIRMYGRISKDMIDPSKVGDYKNPYIGYFSKEGG
ncbi:MAG: hypothetical protein ACPL4E_04670 [Thermoproteota archaeon]